MATGLGAEDSPDLERQVEEIIDFENMLNEVEVWNSRGLRIFLRHFSFLQLQFQKKFTEFRRIYEPHFKNKTSGYKKTPELQKYHKYVRWLRNWISFIDNVFCLVVVHGLVVALHSERYVESIR